MKLRCKVLNCNAALRPTEANGRRVWVCTHCRVTYCLRRDPAGNRVTLCRYLPVEESYVEGS